MRATTFLPSRPLPVLAALALLAACGTHTTPRATDAGMSGGASAAAPATEPSGIAAGASRATVTGGPLAGAPVRRGDAVTVRVWAQLDGEAEVRVAYWRIDHDASVAPRAPDAPRANRTPARSTRDEREAPDTLRTITIRARDTDGFTALVPLTGLAPATRYGYRLEVDGVPVAGRDGRLSTAPDSARAAGDIRIAFGSCALTHDPALGLPVPPRIGSPDVFERIADAAPDVMVWGGDNVYFQADDWSSRERMIARYRHDRAVPALQRLLRVTNHLATWDDHDFGPNDADGTFEGAAVARDVFMRFWGNASYGAETDGRGVSGRQRWGDVEFFLLDDRTFRAPRSAADTGAYFGRAQLDWLFAALAASDATFKLVVTGGQVASPLRIYENYANYGAERDRFLRRLAAARVPGVLVLSGDRHLSELTRMPRAGTYPLYDLTASPLTSNTFSGTEPEPNPWRVPGTWARAHGFALLDVTGPADARVLTITLRDVRGEASWRHVIAARDLRDE